MDSQYAEVGTEPSAGFQFCRLLVRPFDRLGPTHSGKMGDPSAEIKVFQGSGQLHSQTVHITDRTSYSNRETGVVRSSP